MVIINNFKISDNPFKAARVGNGIKQQDAAKHFGVAQSTVSIWETGRGRPRNKLLPLIAEFYNCSIDDLFGYKEVHQ